MKKKILIACVLLCALLLSSCGLSSLFSKEEELTPAAEYTVKDIYSMSSEEFREYMNNGGMEEHAKRLAANYNVSGDIGSEDYFDVYSEDGEDFDASSKWKTGLEYIDMSKFADDLADDGDEFDDSEYTEIPAYLKKYFPAGMKAEYVTDVFIMKMMSVSCDKDTILGVYEKMLADGYEEMTKLDQENTLYIETAKKGAYHITITHSGDSAVFQISDISKLDYDD